MATFFRERVFMCVEGWGGVDGDVMSKEKGNFFGVVERPEQQQSDQQVQQVQKVSLPEKKTGSGGIPSNIM